MESLDFVHESAGAYKIKRFAASPIGSPLTFSRREGFAPLTTRKGVVSLRSRCPTVRAQHASWQFTLFLRTVGHNKQSGRSMDLTFDIQCPTIVETDRSARGAHSRRRSQPKKRNNDKWQKGRRSSTRVSKRSTNGERQTTERRGSPHPDVDQSDPRRPPNRWLRRNLRAPSRREKARLDPRNNNRRKNHQA